MDPKVLVERTFGNRRLLVILIVLAMVYGVLALFLPLARMHHGVASPTPVSHLSFARNLASGHFFLDGPLADVITEFHEGKERNLHPACSTKVRSDGKTIYTEAIGYPLLLAIAIKLVGISSALYLNFLFLALALALFFLCIWEGFGRTVMSAITASTACLLLLRSNPAIIQQFTFVWREPALYASVLGGVYGLIRFIRTGRKFPLFTAALLLGFSVSLKEADAVYAAVIGLSIFFSRTFREHPQRGQVLALFILGSLVGAIPLLVQNTMANGNPLLSSQFARAMGQVNEGGAEGISPSHIQGMINNYLLMYSPLQMFSWPLLLTAGAGALVAIRKGMIGSIFAGLLLTHWAIYFQWSNADFRHMFFAHFPYALFLATGLLEAMERVCRLRPTLQPYTPWVAMVPMLGMALWPVPMGWRDNASQTKSFEIRHGQALNQEVITWFPENQGLILSNQVLRDVLAIYTDLPVIRLHDLAMAHPQHKIKPVLDWFMNRDFRVVFVDNTSPDPRNAKVRNSPRRDRERILHHYDLIRIGSLSRDALHLDNMVKQLETYAFEVSPWAREKAIRSFPVTVEPDAAFLYVNPRASGKSLRVSLNGVTTTNDPAGFLLRTVTGIPTRQGADVILEANGEAVAAHEDAVLVSWHDPIELEFGTDAMWPDASIWPKGINNQPNALYREFEDGAFTIRVPVRQTDSSFTTIGLAINPTEPITDHVYVTVQPDGLDPTSAKWTGHTLWFPVRIDKQSAWAGTVDVSLRTNPPTGLKASRLESFSSQQELQIDPNSETCGVLLVGRLIPTMHEEGPHSWSLRVNGHIKDSGENLDNISHSLHPISMLLTGKIIAPQYDILIEGGGIIDENLLEIGPSLEILPNPGNHLISLCDKGLYKSELENHLWFAWTQNSLPITVPVQSGTSSYRLTLHAENGHPHNARSVTLRGPEFKRQSLSLPETRDFISFEVHTPVPQANGMRNLILEVNPWIPEKIIANNKDRRALGFRLYGLAWSPAPSPRQLERE